MTPFRVAFALVLVMVAVLLAAGCAQLAGNEKSTLSETTAVTGTIPVSSGPSFVNARSDEEMVHALKMYRENLTYPRNRIPENILQVTDPTFPETEITREQAREQMIESRHLVPGDQAIKRFSLTNTPGKIIGDQVFLTIYVYPNTPTDILDMVVTNMSNRKGQFHMVEAWVDVGNLEKLAAMDGVRGFHLVEYAEYSPGQVIAP